MWCDCLSYAVYLLEFFALISMVLLMGVSFSVILGLLGVLLITFQTICLCLSYFEGYLLSIIPIILAICKENFTSFTVWILSIPSKIGLWTLWFLFTIGTSVTILNLHSTTHYILESKFTSLNNFLLLQSIIREVLHITVKRKQI